jgi:hypothetical protein
MSRTASNYCSLSDSPTYLSFEDICSRLFVLTQQSESREEKSPDLLVAGLTSLS